MKHPCLHACPQRAPRAWMAARDPAASVGSRPAGYSGPSCSRSWRSKPPSKVNSADVSRRATRLHKRQAAGAGRRCGCRRGQSAPEAPKQKTRQRCAALPCPAGLPDRICHGFQLGPGQVAGQLPRPHACTATAPRGLSRSGAAAGHPPGPRHRLDLSSSWAGNALQLGGQVRYARCTCCARRLTWQEDGVPAPVAHPQLVPGQPHLLLQLVQQLVQLGQGLQAHRRSIERQGCEALRSARGRVACRLLLEPAAGLQTHSSQAQAGRQRKHRAPSLNGACLPRQPPGPAGLPPLHLARPAPLPPSRPPRQVQAAAAPAGRRPPPPPPPLLRRCHAAPAWRGLQQGQAMAAAPLRCCRRRRLPTLWR